MWNKDNYYRELVSTLYESEESGKHYFNIPVAMEAFLLVAYENNYRKYKAIVEDKKSGEDVTRGMLGSPSLECGLAAAAAYCLCLAHSCLSLSTWQAQSTTTSLLSIHKPIVVRKNSLDGVLMV